MLTLAERKILICSVWQLLFTYCRYLNALPRAPINYPMKTCIASVVLSSYIGKNSQRRISRRVGNTGRVVGEICFWFAVIGRTLGREYTECCQHKNHPLSRFCFFRGCITRNRLEMYRYVGLPFSCVYSTRMPERVGQGSELGQQCWLAWSTNHVENERESLQLLEQVRWNIEACLAGIIQQKLFAKNSIRRQNRK